MSSDTTDTHQNDNDHHHEDNHNSRQGYTKQGELQRQTLIKAAFHLIAEEGLEGLRTRDVATRAHVNIATLHYYFATKEDLIHAVVVYLQALFSRDQPSIVMGDPFVEFQLEIKDTYQRLKSQPEIYIVILEIFVRAVRDLSIRPYAIEMLKDWMEHIESYMKPGVQQSFFRANLDTQVAPQILMGIIIGNIMQHLLSYPTPPLPEHIISDLKYWILAQPHDTMQ